MRPRQHLSYYSNQMKIQAVKEYLKGGVSMLSVCAKYRISGIKHGLRRIMSKSLVSEGGDLMKRHRSRKEKECIASGCEKR